MSSEETPGAHTPGLCRSCAADVTPSVDRCPECGSPRLLRHPELHTLGIAHIDCDAFYASVEKRDDPSLRDKPVIVGGGKRGVVSAACYVARIKGIHSAMPMFKALEACPDAIVIRPDMAKYAAVGGEVRRLMQETTPLVEPLSIDEAFLDLTGTERLHAASPAKTLVRLITRIERDIGVTASVGLSHNKFLAKLASDMDKPRGFTVIGRKDTLDLLAQQPVYRVWGVGKALHRHLKADGIATIGQLRQYDEATLVKRYGGIGQRLYRFSRGEDYRRVTPRWPAKTLSTETTFFDDVNDFDELARRLWPLCERLSERLKAKELSGRTVTLKLKTKGFRLLTRSHTLAAPTQLAETLYQTALPPLRRAADGTAYRLIGIGASMLHAAAEADPPDLADPDAGKRKRVETAMDAVRARLGREAIVKGRGFTTRQRA
ncbi:MAG: DNA polymerase IV [Alphaproteobacteria bacterium]